MIETPEIGRLAAALGAGRVVVVVGSGLSAATTEGDPCATWVGFLRSGIKFAADNGIVNADKVDTLNAMLASATAGDSDLNLLLSSATAIDGYISGTGQQARANWLRDTIGALAVKDPGWIDAIGRLPAPILTTNYDSLFEQRTGRPGVTRGDAAAFQAAVSRSSNAIVHLHGIWSDPPSIVLTHTDYASLLFDETSIALEKAVSATMSMLYIGFGAGINDPNFAKLLEWHRRTFTNSAVEHFRLCRSHEETALKSLHVDQNITPVAYGTNYSDLPTFVERLQASYDVDAYNDLGLARNVPQEARERIIADLAAELNLDTNASGAGGGRSLAEILVDPVLLPSPHSEYVSRSKDDPTTKRLDPLEEAGRSGVVIVVGEEHSGLTTTLRWMALQGSLARGAVSPIYVNFKDVSAGNNPLERLVRRQAIEANIIERKRDPLPPNIVVLDDFNPFVPKISGNVLGDVTTSNTTACTFIGCRPGDEGRTVEMLRGLTVEPRVRYVGKVNKADVAAMAQIVAPLAPKSLIEQVVTILRSERLPRSPFTVQLLIEILLQGEEVVATPSLTGVLEQYLSVLLGRGNPTVDSRYAIGVEQGLTALSAVAHLFAQRGRVCLPEADVIARLEEITTRFSWSESPSEMLLYFRKVRVLRVDNRGVSFVRSSYLHLLAARWANRDKEFCKFLQQDVLRYSKILRHYAGLRRSDGALLHHMLGFLATLAKDHGQSALLEPVAEREAPNHLVVEHSEVTASTEERTNGDLSDNGADHVDELDALPDVDREPFPVVSITDTPHTIRLIMALETASAILRDSDEVDDLAVKRQLLRAVLHGWGEFIVHMAEDHELEDLRRVIIDDLREQNSEFAERHEQEIGDLFNLIPCAMVAGGVERNLASRKLLRTLHEILDSSPSDTIEADLTTAEAAVAVFLLFFIQEPDWVSHAAALGEQHKKSWIFVNFVPLLYMTMLLNDVVQTSNTDLINEIAERMVNEYRFKSAVERHRAKERLTTIVRNVGRDQQRALQGPEQ